MIPKLFLQLVPLPFIYFIVGWLWYSPWLFGRIWHRAMKLNELTVSRKDLFSKLFMSFLLMILIAIGVYRLQLYAPNPLEGAQKSLLVGLLLIMPSIGINSVYDGKPLKVFLIDTCYHLVGLTLMASYTSYILSLSA